MPPAGQVTSTAREKWINKKDTKIGNMEEVDKANNPFISSQPFPYQL